MIHNVRINGEVKEIDCELGSGVLDKNGIEIFEGDTVVITQKPHFKFKCKAIMRLWASDEKLWFDSKHWQMEIVHD